MTIQSDTAVLAAIAEKINAMAPMAQRAARHRALVASTNAIISDEADRHLSFDMSLRSFEDMLRAATETPPKLAFTVAVVAGGESEEEATADTESEAESRNHAALASDSA